MPVNRNQDPYGGRFASDPTGGSVLAGYQQATDKLDRDLVKRNIKPYAKYGFEQSISELAGMTDQRRYAMATKAVLAKNKVGAKKTSGKSGGGTSKGGGKGSSGGGSGGRAGTSRGGGSKKPSGPSRQQQARSAAKKAQAAAKKAMAEARRRQQRMKPPQQHLPPKPPPRLPPKTKPRLPPKPTPKRPPVVPPSGAIRV